MSTDYAQKEREFLDELKADTGRDLAEWMAAISAENLPHRNDIIDWLRRQGFMFSKASWLERIHHNGGKPIYANTPAAKPTDGDRRPRTPVTKVVEPPSAEPAPRPPDPLPPPTTAAPPDVADPSAMETLLAKAKAYRPLAMHLMREIARAVPTARFAPEAGYVSIRAGAEFAIIDISAKELRLGLALGDAPAETPAERARFAPPAARISPAITHMVVLNDARQVTATLTALVRRAAAPVAD